MSSSNKKPKTVSNSTTPSAVSLQSSLEPKAPSASRANRTALMVAFALYLGWLLFLTLAALGVIR
jgi:hypothetical protein